MKKTVAVIFGGRSPEYGVSLQSAAAVLESIDRKRYTVIPVGITRRGDWFRYDGGLRAIREDTWWQDRAGLTAVAVSQDRSVHGLMEFRPGGLFTRLDMAFPVLHGRNGEDGTVQGLLELAGIPVVGCGTLASALCMDKARAHALAAAAGVAVPRGVTVGREEAGALAALTAGLACPLFVKPVRAGSSFGISRVLSREDLPAAAERAFAHDSRIVIEEAVAGFEVGCAILGRKTLTLGRVDEIALEGGFFDFTEKYSLKTSKIHMPARVDGETEERVREAAVKIYRALDCAGFARVDLFLTPAGEIVFNEVNTIPGLTAHSRFPNMMRGVGLELEDVVARLLEETWDENANG